MKKGQVYEGSVVRVDFPNKGIVCVGEETAVVKNSLPGQKVKFSVNKVRKGKAEGRLLEVTEKSHLWKPAGRVPFLGCAVDVPICLCPMKNS